MPMGTAASKVARESFEAGRLGGRGAATWGPGPCALMSQRKTHCSPLPHVSHGLRRLERGRAPR